MMTFLVPSSIAVPCETKSKPSLQGGGHSGFSGIDGVGTGIFDDSLNWETSYFEHRVYRNKDTIGTECFQLPTDSTFVIKPWKLTF